MAKPLLVKTIKRIILSLIGVAVLAGMFWYINTYIYKFYATAPTVSVDSSTTVAKVNQGNEFNVVIGFANHNIETVDLILIFDKDKLSYQNAVSSLPANYFKNPPDYAKVTDAGTNKSQLRLILLANSDVQRAKALTVNLKFKALKSGTATIAVDKNSVIAGIDDNNKAVNFEEDLTKASRQIVIEAPSDPSPTVPTSTPQADPFWIGVKPSPGGIYPWSNGGPTAGWESYLGLRVYICNGEWCWTIVRENNQTILANNGLPFQMSQEPAYKNGIKPSGDRFPWTQNGPTAAWTWDVQYNGQSVNETLICNGNLCWRYIRYANGEGEWRDGGNPINLTSSDFWKDKPRLYTNNGPTVGWTDPINKKATLCNGSYCESLSYANWTWLGTVSPFPPGKGVTEYTSAWTSPVTNIQTLCTLNNCWQFTLQQDGGTWSSEPILISAPTSSTTPTVTTVPSVTNQPSTAPTPTPPWQNTNYNTTTVFGIVQDVDAKGAGLAGKYWRKDNSICANATYSNSAQMNINGNYLDNCEGFNNLPYFLTTVNNPGNNIAYQLQNIPQGYECVSWEHRLRIKSDGSPFTKAEGKGCSTGPLEIVSNNASSSYENSHLIWFKIRRVVEPTPTSVLEKYESVLKMTVKLQGIQQAPREQYRKLDVNVILKGGGQNVKEELVEFSAQPDGTWIGSLGVDGINAATKYELILKGAKHLAKKICVNTPTEQLGGSYRCTDANINLQKGENVLDFSGIILLGGDLPQQDGIINALDFAFIRQNLGSQAPEDLIRGDINLDGIIDTQDHTAIKTALEFKYDEE